MNACKLCGKPVAVRSKDYVFQDGSKGVRAGVRLGSDWMRANDPNCHFCTMRCAAAFGINAANARGHAKARK